MYVDVQFSHRINLPFVRIHSSPLIQNFSQTYRKCSPFIISAKILFLIDFLSNEPCFPFSHRVKEGKRNRSLRLNVIDISGRKIKCYGYIDHVNHASSVDKWSNLYVNLSFSTINNRTVTLSLSVCKGWRKVSNRVQLSDINKNHPINVNSLVNCKKKKKISNFCLSIFTEKAVLSEANN